jgi:hypothetical protein
MSAVDGRPPLQESLAGPAFGVAGHVVVPSLGCASLCNQCQQEDGSQCKLPVAGCPEGGQTMLYMFLSLSVTRPSADCTNTPFQTKPRSLCS